MATRLLFEIGADPRASTRVVDVAFDSSGTPLTLVAVSTDHDPDGASLLEAVAARFTKEGTVAGLHTRQRGAALAESTATTVAGSTRTPLTEREGADARRLASWFWARRCGRQNGVKIR